jgi:hypothetical protein
VIVGAWLTGRSHRREWIADNQKDEYRKLLVGLNRLNMTLLLGVPIDRQEMTLAMEEITVALNTSLFIDDFLKKSGVMRDILDAVRQLEQKGNVELYRAEYWKAVNLIIAAAKKIPI